MVPSPICKQAWGRRKKWCQRGCHVTGWVPCSSATITQHLMGATQLFHFPEISEILGNLRGSRSTPASLVAPLGRDPPAELRKGTGGEEVTRRSLRLWTQRVALKPTLYTSQEGWWGLFQAGKAPTVCPGTVLGTLIYTLLFFPCTKAMRSMQPHFTGAEMEALEI